MRDEIMERKDRLLEAPWWGREDESYMLTFAIQAGLLEPRYRVAQIQEEKAMLESSAAVDTPAAVAEA